MIIGRMICMLIPDAAGYKKGDSHWNYLALTVDEKRSVVLRLSY